jgi:cell division septal protein FtsQ
MGRRRQKRPRTGLVPSLGRGAVIAGQWLISHPQPLLALSLAAAIGFGAWKLAVASDAFTITSIEASPEIADAVPDVRGQNLWTVNLGAVADAVHGQLPELRWVRASRMPPSTVTVAALARAPVAQVQLAQWHAVDAEGFVFAASSREAAAELVMLRGVADPKAPLKAGRVNDTERLRAALQMQEELSRAGALRGHRVAAIDVADPRQLSFILDDGIEVRCGSADQLPPQLARLQAVLQRVARQPFGIRYIDVRFPEPVIGPKT